MARPSDCWCSGRILEAEACRLLGVVASNGHVANNALPAVTKLLGQYKAWQRLCFGSLQAVCQAADTVASLVTLASRGVGNEHEVKEVAVLLVQILFNVEDLQVNLLHPIVQGVLTPALNSAIRQTFAHLVASKNHDQLARK